MEWLYYLGVGDRVGMVEGLTEGHGVGYVEVDTEVGHIVGDEELQENWKLGC